MLEIVMWEQEIELTWRNFTNSLPRQVRYLYREFRLIKKKKIGAFISVNFTPLKKWEIQASFHSSWAASRSTRLQILPSSLSHGISGFQVASTKIGYVEAQLLHSCPTLCEPANWIPPGSSIPGILQARTVAWVTMYSSRRSYQLSDGTQVPYIAGGFFTTEPPGKPN